MKLSEKLLNLFFPPKCPFCVRVQDSVGICVICEKELPWTKEGETLWEGTGGVRCVAPLWYEEKARDGLLRLKFQGVSAAAKPIGALIARCAAEHFSGEFDTVTWVPVSRKRLRKRGYDQAELLTRSACCLWETEPLRLLVKVVDNPAQSGLTDAAARRANVLGVYEIARGGEVTGKRILLVDDICTTGATLAECVRVLRDAGASDVVCAVAARARERKKVHKIEREWA
ncbi:MAG: ComF family protein [Ruminococcaceae bacterium]|nr:ComF family protein [Oscillospiraceae bacterium]